MNTLLTPLRRLVPALALLAAAVPAHAQLPLAQPAVPGLVQTAAADCGAIGRSLAAGEGGTVQLAVAENRGGRTVCVIVYTVPGSNGKPPRRVQREVPAD
jgi:hypothetical protein